MTADEYLLKKGLAGGLTEMSKMTDVARRTLDDWYKSDRYKTRFDKILQLCIRVQRLNVDGDQS